ncbi:hypothetical protein KJ612_06660, partial [Myxococcota bacterium]|nr:hypothetical protein [Myxococcota bacterium]
QYCGNAAIEAPEACDGSNLNGKTCLTEGFVWGTLACASDCMGLDTSGCLDQYCGNDAIESPEACDGSNLNGKTCLTEGFVWGTLACATGCMAVDTSACLSQYCGNDAIESPEVCDGSNLNGKTCLTEGFVWGTLACATGCMAVDTSACLSQYCGNGAIESPEVCDGTDFNGETCASQGFAGGTLACAPDCGSLNTAGCSNYVCGNGAIEAPEVCDGADVNGESCISQGFVWGTLACASGCLTFDTSACLDQYCGNDAIESPEVCDGTALNGETCASQGCRGTGTLLCIDDCTDFDLTGCYAGHDEDGDTVDDNCDNCPTYTNLSQANADGDGVGDTCESPAGAGALSSISFFEPFLTITGWTLTGGTWTQQTDLVRGNSGGNTSAVFIRNGLALPANNYSVETTYYYNANDTAGGNYSGVTFAYKTDAGGTMVSAFACLYERDNKRLEIWEFGGGVWNSRRNATITTNANNGATRKIRAYVNDSGNIRCVFSDTAGTGDINWTKPGTTATTFTGAAGLRVYNDVTNFYSFIYYQ